MSGFTRQDFTSEYSYNNLIKEDQKKIIKVGDYIYWAYNDLVGDWDGQTVRVLKSLDGINWIDTNHPLPLEEGWFLYFVCIEADNTNKIHVMSHDYSNTIEYTTYIEGEGWTREDNIDTTLPDRAIDEMFLMIDSNNKKHLIFTAFKNELGVSFYSRLYYMYENDDEWTAASEIHPSDTTRMMAANARMYGDVIHIAVWTRSKVGIYWTDDSYEYLYRESGNWVDKYVIYDRFSFYNMEVDRNGVHIIYSDVDDKIYYIRKFNNIWSTPELVKDLALSGYTLTSWNYYLLPFSIKSNGDIDLVFVITTDSGYYDLFYIKKENGIWSSGEIITDSQTSGNSYVMPVIYSDSNVVLIKCIEGEDYNFMYSFYKLITQPEIPKPTTKQNTLPRFKPVELINSKENNLADGMRELNRNLDWMFKSLTEAIIKRKELKNK